MAPGGWVMWEVASLTTRALSGGNAIVWTPVDMSAMVPPGARILLLAINQAANAVITRVRERNTGVADTGRPRFAGDGDASQDASNLMASCDASQYIDYVESAGGGSVSIYCSGYLENR